MKRFVALIVAFSLFLLSCEPITGGGDPEKPIDRLIDEGKTYLALGDGKSARDIFLEVLVFEPKNTDAHFGIALADILRLIKLVEALDEYIQDYLSHGKLKGAKDEEGLGDFIHRYVERLILSVAEEITYHTWQIYKLVPEEKFYFYLSNYPITYKGNLILSCKGEWDGAELRLVWGFGHLAMGFSHLLLGTDLNFNIFPLLNLPIDWTTIFENPQSLNLQELLPLLLDALLQILTDPNYPNFLLLTPGGRELYSLSGVELGLFFLSIVDSGHFIMNETDPQQDDVIGYIDLNNSGHYEEGDAIRLPEPIGALDESEYEILWGIFHASHNLSRAFFDATYMDPHPSEPDPFHLSDLNPLLSALLKYYGYNPILLPDFTIDIGPYFQNPTPEELKQTAIELLLCLNTLLSCIEEAESSAESIQCILQSLQCLGNIVNEQSD